MVLRVDLIADIYLTSSIPMVPFRTTWKLHMDFIEKSFNCFLYLNETSFFSFFFFHFLRTFVSFLPFPRIFLFFHADSRFDFFLLKHIFSFYTFKIFSFVQNYFPSSKSSRALVNFISRASYICTCQDLSNYNPSFIYI